MNPGQNPPTTKENNATKQAETAIKTTTMNPEAESANNEENNATKQAETILKLTMNPEESANNEGAMLQNRRNRH
jgi:hypothetical protein